MKANGRTWIARAGAVLLSTALGVLAIAVGGLAPALAAGGSWLPAHFSGLFNDYGPSTITNGPYEMRGKWTLDLHTDRGMATFSAAMTMETSDYGISEGIVDPATPATRGAHTHNISVTDGVIHDGPSDWMTMCPSLKPPAAGGFVVTGSANITANGGNPPFGNPSAVTICILGGVKTEVAGTPYASVEFSNFTLTFATPASTHFGIQPIHGVVQKCFGPAWQELRDCMVAVQNEEE